MNGEVAELMAYLDDELDQSRRRDFESRLTQDLALQHRVAQMRSLSMQLRDRFDASLAEPMPERLLEVANELAATLVDTQASPRRRWFAPEGAAWWAAAASLVLGLVLGYQSSRLSGLPAPVGIDASGRIIAQGPLARSLDHRLAADPSPTDASRPGISFVSRSGGYCRTFTSGSGHSSLAGLACREGDVWHVRMMETQSTASEEGGGYRQAASGLSPAILQSVQSLMRDEPLDATEEVRARDAGWR